jgi:hypothetical protein
MGTDAAVSAVEHASTYRPGSSSSEGALLWFREEHLPPAPTAPSYARMPGRKSSVPLVGLHMQAWGVQPRRRASPFA